MKYVIITLLILVSAFCVLLVVASLQPKDWKLERSVLIKAPPAKVWAVVSDFSRFNEWNPYYHADPGAKVEYLGPAATVGSRYTWDGAKSGAGTITTKVISPNERLDYELDFKRPMAVINEGAFVLSRTDDEDLTRMTWIMSGVHSGFAGLVSRMVYLFYNKEKMLGPMFEDGLSRLKMICEK